MKEQLLAMVAKDSVFIRIVKWPEYRLLNSLSKG